MGRRILRISSQMFPRLFSGEHHYRVIKDPIPADARVVHIALNYTGGDVRERDVDFVLESPQWSDVPDGEPIPDIMPIMKSLSKVDED